MLKKTLLILSLLSSSVFAYDSNDFKGKKFSCMDMTGRINYYLDISFHDDSVFTLRFQSDEALTRGLKGDYKVSGNEIHLRGRPYYESNDPKQKDKVDEMNNKLKNALYKESFYHIKSYAPTIKSMEIDEVDIDKKKQPTSRFCNMKQ